MTKISFLFLFFVVGSFALLDIEIEESSSVSQFHGDPIDNNIANWMAGNQFVVLDLLNEAFLNEHPEYANIFTVTLPPGLLLNAINDGGFEFKSKESLFPEGLKLTRLPEGFSTVTVDHITNLANQGKICRSVTYTHNGLSLMVRSSDGFPASATGAEVYSLLTNMNYIISEPDIVTQGISRHFWQMYHDISNFLVGCSMAGRERAPWNSANVAVKNCFNGVDGGFNNNFGCVQDYLALDPPCSLRRILYREKFLAGKTIITKVHHLESPLYLEAHTADIGTVWKTEIKFEIDRHNNTGLAGIDITGDYPPGGPPGDKVDRSDVVNYQYTILEDVVRTRKERCRAARAYRNFLVSSTAQSILNNAGFVPATQQELSTFTDLGIGGFCDTSAACFNDKH